MRLVDNANANFLTVTGHFVHNYELKTASLATRKLLTTTNHGSQNIADTLRKILNEWKILNKTVCIVTDNASSMLKACEILEIRNLPCFAHTINLVVQNALKVDDKFLKDLFTKCKSIVRFFKQSTIACEKFKLAQEGSALTLLNETPTRWNSFYFMIERILKTNDAIAKVLLTTTGALHPFTAEEILVLKDIEKILSFFQQASEKNSGGKYVTISFIIPMAYGLSRKVQSVLLETSQETSIKKRLSIYEQRTVCRMATLLDPRFKKNGFQHSSNAEQASTLFENELANFAVKESAIDLPVVTETISQDTLFDFLGEQSANKKTNVRVDAILTKRQYLERAIASQDIDPLLWIKVCIKNEL